MNAFDLVFWSLAALLLIRLIATDDPRPWLALGLLLGVGLLNKISLLFFGAGLGVAVVATPLRRHLRHWQLWAGAGVALLLFVPHLLWQARHDWPTLEFMANAMRYKNAPLSPLAFLAAQLVENHPFNALLWLGGLAWLAADREGRRFRAVAWLFLTVLALMLATRSKPYYLAGAFPALLVAGSKPVSPAGHARPYFAGATPSPK